VECLSPGPARRQRLRRSHGHASESVFTHRNPSGKMLPSR
jgi:hypothetical protein